MDTLLYDLSIPVISSLQTSLGKQASFLQSVSVVFDPKYAFLIYSPLAYLLDRRVGKKLIMTIVMAEWLNQILKWLLHGERPYWYVHSSGHFDAQQVPIKQFPVTCELGPGHPSGHAMVTAAVWYIILDALVQAYQQHSPPQHSQELTQPPSQTSDTNTAAKRRSRADMTSVCASAWTVYVVLLALVSVSRVFLGCHFPHQCVAGALLGLLTARLVSSVETRGAHFVAVACFLFASAFATFGLLQALGFDPSWTIALATTHCEKREYIHLDTAPFFSIMRYCGFALGCGLGMLMPVARHLDLLLPIRQASGELKAAHAHNHNHHDDDDDALVAKDKAAARGPFGSSQNFTWFSVRLAMALLTARLVDNLALFVSPASLSLYYAAAFASYTGFSFVLVNL